MRIVTLLLASLPLVLGAQDTSGQQARDLSVEILHVQGSVYLIAGEHGNTAVQVGDDGVLVVDSQAEAMSEAMLSAIRGLSNGPIRYVLNTSADSGHAGGNAYLASGGDPVIAATLIEPQPIPLGARIVAHERVLLRMAQEDVDAASWPNETYFTDWHDIYFNGEAVRLFQAPAAHTDGDSLVFFRRSDVISAGDVFTTTGYPVIDLDRGGSAQGLIDALNRIIDLTVLARHGEGRRSGGTLVIPGHGRICDQTDVVHYRDMVTIVRDRIRALISRGLSLEQVLEARPIRDYDTRYAAAGELESARFVESVYRSLVRDARAEEAR
jgi:cyclase